MTFDGNIFTGAILMWYLAYCHPIRVILFHKYITKVIQNAE